MGLATIVYYLTGFPMGITNFVVNGILLIIGYRILGGKFGLNTIIGMTTASLSLILFQQVLDVNNMEYFKFENMDVKDTPCKNGKPDSWSMTVSADITNTGDIAGKDAVQLYIVKKDRKADDPFFTLKQFKKIALKKGEKKNVAFKLTAKDFETIDKNGESILVPGEYVITISDSVPTERSKALGATEPVNMVVRI